MGKQYVVNPEPLTGAAFAPYGIAIVAVQPPAPKTGVDWDCWFPLAALSAGQPSVGLVVTRPTQAPITAMEREPVTEMVIPVERAIVQLVALPGDLRDYTQQPDAATVRAFVVRPGQGIVMAPGTWHWAALPLEEPATYYFATEPHPPEPGREDSPWVPFGHGDTVRLVLPA